MANAKVFSHSNEYGDVVVDVETGEGYTDTRQVNSTPLGTVTWDEYDTGALVRIEATGIYGQVKAGAIRRLDRRKVAAARSTAAR